MQSPKLRFKDDDGSEYPAWEEMKLGDIGSVAMCKRVYKAQTSTEGDVPFFKIGTFGGEPDAFISRELYESLRRKYSFPAKGTILLSASGTIGRQVVYNGEDAYYQDSNIVWLDHDNTVIDDFLRQFYNVVTWQGLEGITIKRLYNKMILETSFNRPCFLEQHKIANLLSSVDEIIAAQQAEVEAWEMRKRGVMQQLFSQQVRFEADDGSEYPTWEEKTLGECCIYGKKRCGGGNYVGTDNMLQDFTGVRFDDDAETSGIAYEIGDVLMSNIRPYLKKVWWADREGVCSTDVLVFHPTDIESSYLHHLLASDSFIAYVMSAAKGSKMPRGDKNHIMGMRLLKPCAEEQQKIADCLSSFDEVIAKARAELEQWQLLKKGLLQQMFV